MPRNVVAQLGTRAQPFDGMRARACLFRASLFDFVQPSMQGYMSLVIAILVMLLQNGRH
jgi:hypothetical protein